MCYNFREEVAVKSLTILALLAAAAAALAAGEITIKDSSYRTLAYIYEDGTVKNSS